jgi:hypothetical protein
MGDVNEFREKLETALDLRGKWIEKTFLPKLKEDFRVFHTSVATLYNIFVRRGYIADDPYKSDSKTDDLKVPDNGPFAEANKRDQIGQRISALVKEFDFLVSFYPFSIDNFGQNKIKIIIGLVRYIDWAHISQESDSPLTAAIADIVSNARRGSGDAMTIGLMNEIIIKLEELSETLINSIKVITEFNREVYKLNLRIKVTSTLSKLECQLPVVRKKFSMVCRGEPFYQELADDVLKEDYSDKSEVLREKVLKKLAVPEEKLKVSKQQTNLKAVVIEALNAIGGAGTVFSDVTAKFNENSEILRISNGGIWDKVKKIVVQMSNKDNEPIFYDIGITTSNGSITKERINFSSFLIETEKKSKILSAIASRNTAAKLEAMEEEQLVDLLQRNIKDVTNLNKFLDALDEYFKENVDRAERSRIKGIKPEIGAIKIALSKASQKLSEYNALKEEMEQFKKLGVDVES